MLKENLKKSFGYLIVLAKWVILSVIVGCIGGIVGSTFHILIDKATELRGEYQFILYFLPLGGLLIALLYRLAKNKGAIDTNRVIESARENKEIPLIMVPLIYVSTIITHLLGGSAGREGAALQLGGSIGYNTGKLLRLDKKNMHIVIMTGMAAVFSALFGTPVTAAVFSVEVITVGAFYYASFVPCVISGVTAYMISGFFGLEGVRFLNVTVENLTVLSISKVLVLAVLCAVLSIVFCVSIKKCEHTMEKFLKNSYIRAFIGGLGIVILSVLLRTYDYNGAGMDVITRAINGDAKTEAFILKIIFTAITIAAGFKGGEIVPAFFVGSTFGCVVAPLLGLDPSFAAAIGFVALFCGVVNCPVASIILSIEIFGADGLIFFAIACAVSYLMSGSFGLYKKQKILYSKFDDVYIDEFTK